MLIEHKSQESIMRFTTAPFTVLAMIGYLAAANTTAQAADRFAVISVANQTEANLVVNYRWGNGSWTKATIGPKRNHLFWYEYPNPTNTSSPDMCLNFDADVGASKYQEAKKLHGFRVPDKNYSGGHHYAFRYDGATKKYIEIFDTSRNTTTAFCS